MRKSYIFESALEPNAVLTVTEDPRPNLVRFEIFRDGGLTAIYLTKETVEELKDIFSTWGDHVRWVDPPMEFNKDDIEVPGGLVRVKIGDEAATTPPEVKDPTENSMSYSDTFGGGS